MVFECADCPLRGVPLVDMGGHKLVCAVVGTDGLEVGLACFIVQDMVGRGMARHYKVGVDLLIGCDAGPIKFGSKGADQDGIGAVQGHHDILVATAGMGVEAASIICEDVGERDFMQLNCICREYWEAW